MTESKSFEKQIYSDNFGEWYVGDIINFITENNVPLQRFSVNELAELSLVASPNDVGDEKPGTPEFDERADRSDIKFPIIVIEYPDGKFIADGNHRLRKAQMMGKDSIIGFYLTDDDLHGIPTIPNLSTTMLSVAVALSEMEDFILSLKSDRATVDILKIIAAEQNHIKAINANIRDGKYSEAFKKILGHAMPRGDGFFLRKNYDYGEAWPSVLDEFRKGKIKNVVDMARKLRRWKGDKTKEKVDHSVDVKKDISKKKILQRAEQESLIPLDSYCGKEKNKEYWEKLRADEEEYNQAIEDFIEYATEEIKC